MTSKIYIVTRFNAPCFPTRKDLAERRLDDDWLRERVRLFKEYCYPSVIGQTYCFPHEWIIWCHPGSPGWMRDELRSLCAPYINKFCKTSFVYEDSYYHYINTDVDTLVTIRLDNDDMIHEWFMRYICDHIEVFQKSGLPRQVYSFTKGYRYYDVAQKGGRPQAAGSLVEVEMPNNPFLVMFANLREKPATDTDHLVYFTNHGQMSIWFPTVYNNELRAWAWIYHGGNTASIQCKQGDVVDNKILIVHYNIILDYGCAMNKERFDELRVPGEVNWDDACVIRDTILEHDPRTVLELGCFRGLSTLVILDALKENWYDHGIIFTSVDIRKMGELYNIKDVKEAKRSQLVPPDAPVTHITSDALKYLNGLPDGSIDLIFEDTNHQTAYTLKLIPEMLRVLKEKGVLIFHDLNLGTIQRAYRKAGLLKKVKRFPPSRMGMLRKKGRTWV